MRQHKELAALIKAKHMGPMQTLLSLCMCLAVPYCLKQAGRVSSLSRQRRCGRARLHWCPRALQCSAGWSGGSNCCKPHAYVAWMAHCGLKHRALQPLVLHLQRRAGLRLSTRLCGAILRAHPVMFTCALHSNVARTSRL